jgi:phosphoribosylformimino-5-aminoimidazole carboxamide ribotide isomerase
VRSLDDIRKLKEMGLYGVIVGRALYEGKIKVEDLVEFAN